MEANVRSAIAFILAALLLLTSCASSKSMTPEELEAIRKSNERYERSKGP
jgi:major membrane immunogen (membrane-anchored lipoprotein)